MMFSQYLEINSPSLTCVQVWLKVPDPYNTGWVKSPLRPSSSRRENLVRLDVCLTISPVSRVTRARARICILFAGLSQWNKSEQSESLPQLQHNVYMTWPAIQSRPMGLYPYLGMPEPTHRSWLGSSCIQAYCKYVP
jgi:hypothetical protein